MSWHDEQLKNVVTKQLVNSIHGYNPQVSFYTDGKDGMVKTQIYALRIVESSAALFITQAQTYRNVALYYHAERLYYLVQRDNCACMI